MKSRIIKVKKAKENKPGCYIISMIASLVLVSICKTIDHFWGTNIVPFKMLEFWKFDLNLIKNGLYVSLIIFAWGISLKTLHLCFSKLKPEDLEISAEQLLGWGFLSSIFAGVMEEIAFRWLIFFNSIVGVKILNFVCLGFLGWDIIAWIYLHIAGPVANFITFGYLKAFLFHPYGWFVGSALISTNAMFRDGHKYQGPIGFINSWIIGFFLFYIVFNYGLVTAILAHAIYDLLIVGITYIYLKFKNNRRKKCQSELFSGQ